MKIVHLILTHSFAGSERYAIELANAQADRHEVSMVLHRRAGEDRPEALRQRLDPRVNVLWVDGCSLWAARAARRQVEALRPDVAHAHLSGGCRALRGLRHRCLRLATLHIHYKPQQHAHLDALIALTPSQLAAIPDALRAWTKQIDNWTQARAASREQGLAQRRAWGVPDEAVLIGALGRVERSKGMGVLVEAAEPLLSDTVRLVLVGKGRDFDELRRRAPPQVLMPGFTQAPADCFAAFDLYVNAADSEPFGLVFLEAMAAGLPIIATATEGARHLAPRHGFALSPCGDVMALREVLRQQLVQRPARRSYDLSAYDPADRVADIETFYREQLALSR